MLLTLAWALTAQVASAQLTPPGATAEVVDAASRVVLVAEFRDSRDELLITMRFPNPGLLTGTHALHIHERGRCDPPGFGSAGGIFNPFGKQHGLLHAGGPMAGDLPDMVLGPRGLTSYNTSSALATLRPGPGSILRPGGSALVVFEGQDDNVSQPEGGTGARIACGVILAPGQTAAAGAEGLSPGPLVVAVVGALVAGAGVVLRRLR